MFFSGVLVNHHHRRHFHHSGFKSAIHNLQFAKHFGSLRMNVCFFSKNWELLKSDTSWIFRVIHWTYYIGSYFKPNKYPLLNNNVISQRFIVHINFKLHTSFISIILLRSNCKPVTSFNPIIYEFFKYFTNHRKKTNRMVVFSCRPYPSILKYRKHWWNLPTIWKTRLLKTLIEEFS